MQQYADQYLVVIDNDDLLRGIGRRGLGIENARQIEHRNHVAAQAEQVDRLELPLERLSHFRTNIGVDPAAAQTTATRAAGIRKIAAAVSLGDLHGTVLDDQLIDTVAKYFYFLSLDEQITFAASFRVMGDLKAQGWMGEADRGRWIATKP